MLIDTAEMGLTFNGVAFQLLSESLVGLSTVFEYDDQGDNELHGFADDDRVVVFAGDRSAKDRTDVTIDFDRFAIGGDYFLVATQADHKNIASRHTHGNQSIPGYVDRIPNLT